jgi:tRNA/rRNA methyltransferase
MTNLSIILVNPQMAENIGAAARAMLNFGISDLRIVNPRDGWPNETAIRNASGAFNVIPPPQIYKTLEDALKDINVVYATTARPRDMVKKVFTPESAAKEISRQKARRLKTGILFGAERTGLTNDQIVLANHIITIPTNPDFWSLNLAQSVLLVSYEIHKTKDKTHAIEMSFGGSDAVSHEELEGMLSRLEQELKNKNFFRSEDLKPTMIRNIRNIFTRPELSEQEVKTMHGIISALIGKKET